MELVKDHQTDALQLRVTQRHTGQNPFGDHFQTGGGTDPGIGSSPVTNGLPHRLAKLGCHEGGHGTGRHPSWLQHQNATLAGSGTIQQTQRHTGGFPCSWRGFQNGTAGLLQGIKERFHHLIDGKFVLHFLRPLLRRRDDGHFWSC